MHRIKSQKLAPFGAVAATALCVVALTTGTANAATPASAIKTVVSGLNAPVSIDFGLKGHLYIAEAADAKITEIGYNNIRRTVASNLPGLAGISVGYGDFKVFAVQGFIPETRSAPASAPVVSFKVGHQPRQIADLLPYELANNPDGQAQNTGPEDDALTNPYAVLALPDHRVLVADAAGNDVIAISPSGRLSTFFAPRNITTGACAGAPNNDAAHPGCDPVPTGLALGANGDIYVSGLGAEAPNAARVWRLDARTGHVKQVWGDLTDAVGVAVGPDGSVYVSELFFGQDPESPTFDPTQAGRIVRIAPNGSRTYAAVPLPGGLLVDRGTLYATRLSVLDEFLPAPTHSGSVVTVGRAAFVPGPLG
jgi:hypothetical protein